MFGLIDLFNSISTPYRLFNAEIWLICISPVSNVTARLMVGPSYKENGKLISGEWGK